MCGIAGYFGPSPPNPERVNACRTLMERRGPDAEGLYEATTPNGLSVCLLHSRLAIIDLNDNARQPFRDGSKTIIYNGELYNFVELRHELCQAGEDFSTRSDTEVLLRILVRDGIEGLRRCEGMWAFAVYDETDGTLVLSRDRFAEKPLFIARRDGGLYFGSEIKFLHALMGTISELNRKQIQRYLTHGYRSLCRIGETFFEGIHELPAGTFLRAELPGSTAEKYWSPALKVNENLSFGAAVEQARALLITSTDRRLRADVPLAFCMSGGVDSNALISIARNVLGRDVQGFTIVNSDARYAEQEMVEIAVKTQDLCHTEVRIDSRGFLDKLEVLVAQHDAPVHTVSAYAHWLLMEAIHERGFKVVIAGTGADELFSGYYDHQLFYLAEIRQEQQLYTEALANWHNYVEPDVRNPLLKDPDIFVREPGFRGHLFFSPDTQKKYMRNPVTEDFPELDFGLGPLRQRMLNELFVETIPPPLHEEDHNAMYYSIENRSPYLDTDLFEFCNSIPTRHLIRGGAAKAVLREAVRGIAPDPILDSRRKVGFNAPIADFLDIENPQTRQRLLDDGPIFDHVNREAIETLVNQPWHDDSLNLFFFYFVSARTFMDAHRG